MAYDDAIEHPGTDDDSSVIFVEITVLKYSSICELDKAGLIFFFPTDCSSHSNFFVLRYN